MTNPRTPVSASTADVEMRRSSETVSCERSSAAVAACTASAFRSRDDHVEEQQQDQGDAPDQLPPAEVGWGLSHQTQPQCIPRERPTLVSKTRATLVDELNWQA